MFSQFVQCHICFSHYSHTHWPQAIKTLVSQTQCYANKFSPAISYLLSLCSPNVIIFYLAQSDIIFIGRHSFTGSQSLFTSLPFSPRHMFHRLLYYRCHCHCIRECWQLSKLPPYSGKLSSGNQQASQRHHASLMCSFHHTFSNNSS